MRRSDRVIEALQRRPTLLYEVLRGLQAGPAVLSPWEPLLEGHDTLCRRDVSGAVRAKVGWSQNTDPGSERLYEWFVYAGDRGDPWGRAEDAPACRVAADMKLREFGYLLAEKEGGRRSAKLATATPWGQRSTGPGAARWDADSGAMLVEINPSNDGLWTWTAHADRTNIVNRGMGDHREAMWAADRWLERQGWELP